MHDAPRRRLTIPFWLLGLCFFGSGLTGLIYEILWTRRLQLTFGSTTFSITTVLAAFMAGLGLGSYLIGRRADRSRIGDLRIYALLELGVGLYALASLPLLSLVESAYAGLQSWLHLGQGGATLLKLALSFPVLTLPAALMGGTLPVIIRHLTRDRAALPSMVGKLYGINTAGAALGTALAGMVLIEHLGLWRSMILAALINLSIAALMLVITRRGSPSSSPKLGAGQPPRVGLSTHLRSPPVLFCAVAVVFTGLLSMLYEVVWTRLLSLVMGSSTYTFTIVLSIFLVGIAMGSLAYGRLSRGRPPTAFGLTLVLLALALWAAVSIAVIPKLPLLMMVMAQLPRVGFGQVLGFEVLLALFILLIPTLLLGAALPMSMGIISRALGEVGRDVGGVYLANTLGAIAGSVLTGFVLIPLWGTQHTLLAGLLLNLVLVAAGVLAFGSTVPRKLLGLAAVGLAGLASLTQPAWPAIVFDSGLGYRLDYAASRDKLELMQKLYRSPTKLLFREEGQNATITVRRYGEGVTLLVNGKPDASTSGDMKTQVLLGIVPTMAHPRPARVGIVGWGSGVTAHAATFFPEVKQIDVVEIEPAVLRASPFFHLVNGKAEFNPRVKVIYDDARSHFLTSRVAYDVIINEPSNPWMMGVSGLFSRDYYALSKERLRPGGIFAQWLQLYSIDARSVALILRTLMASFKYVQLWYSDPGNLILLGSDQPIRFSYERVRRAYFNKQIRLHMDVYGPGYQAEHFFGCFLLESKALARVTDRFDAEVMTDDRPVLEYRALRGLYDPVHPHIKDLWRAKIASGQLLPPIRGTPPPAGLALAGAAAIVQHAPKLSPQVTQWAMERHRDEPQVRLARAKFLVRASRWDEARKVLKTLPATPGYQAEAALVRAQLWLGQGKPVEAHSSLEKMMHFRTTAKLWYQLRAAMDLRPLDRAWSYAEALMEHLGDRTDMDVFRVKRYQYYRFINLLGRRSRQYDRAIRLLKRREEPHGGEDDRLLALVENYHAAGRHKLAAQQMDALIHYQILKPQVLSLCEDVYRAVDATPQADACRDRRLQIQPRPLSKPLWPPKK